MSSRYQIRERMTRAACVIKESDTDKKIEKQITYFIAIFGLILAIFLRSQSYDFDVIAHAGEPLSVERLSKIFKIRLGSF